MGRESKTDATTAMLSEKRRTFWSNRRWEWRRVRPFTPFYHPLVLSFQSWIQLHPKPFSLYLSRVLCPLSHYSLPLFFPLSLCIPHSLLLFYPFHLPARLFFCLSSPKSRELHRWRSDTAAYVNSLTSLSGTLLPHRKICPPHLTRTPPPPLTIHAPSTSGI